MRVAELRRRRAAAQLLVSGERDATDVVRRLLAVQAQDPRAARLALRARGGGEIDEAALVTTWLMRGTLHLVAVEDLGWLHALTGALVAPQAERRLAELGVADPGRALRVIERALADGPLDRGGLADRLRAAGLAAEGQVVPHLLGLAASRGTVVLTAGGYALARDVAPARRGGDRDAALAELARRYLHGHGPAAPADLAAWSGLGLGDARAGFAAIAGELTGGGDGLRCTPPPPERLPPRLLPAFDPYLLGWRDRGFAVDAEHARAVHPGGGIIRAVALVNGRAAGVWRRGRRGVEIEPFAPLPPRVMAALRRQARELRL